MQGMGAFFKQHRDLKARHASLNLGLRIKSNCSVLHVYDLEAKRIRIDSTTSKLVTSH